ncbi:MAG: alpha-hydroxy-acid oxidizing protein [Acidimicrobiia bacterium]
MQAGAAIALDSGIRRGADVVKALALGADVVVSGRAAATAFAVFEDYDLAAHGIAVEGDVRCQVWNPCLNRAQPGSEGARSGTPGQWAPAPRPSRARP